MNRRWIAKCVALLQYVVVAHSLTLGRREAIQLANLLSILDPQKITEPSSPSTRPAFPEFPDCKITDKIFFDVRVARQDGTFYERDDLPDTFENKVLKARLSFGLYGDTTPNTVEKFLSYVVEAGDPNDDISNPLPSYARSTFTALDQSTGLLLGGYIPSLRVVDINGNTALRYGARVLPAKLVADRNPPAHSCKGLLTHRNLDVTPEFGITTRTAPELDNSHTVFGQLLWDDATSEFLSSLQDIPTYSMERPYEDDVGVTTAVFNSQREVFRGIAKTFGDTRVDKIYEGKLLRRMEVTRVGRL